MSIESVMPSKALFSGWKFKVYHVHKHIMLCYAMLSCFSRVRLCVTPQTASYRARQPQGLQPTSSTIHGIFQARVLEWGAIAFSKRRKLSTEELMLLNCGVGEDS